MRLSSSMHARSIACGSRARHDVATRVAARGALALTALLAAAAGLCDAATTPLNPAAVNATSVPWEHMQSGSAGAWPVPADAPAPAVPFGTPRLSRITDACSSCNNRAHNAMHLDCTTLPRRWLSFAVSCRA